MRVGVALALALVGLFEVLSVLHGVRSVRRLRARVAHEAEQRVEEARPALDAALALGGPGAWDRAAQAALARGLASEVEVIDAEGRVLFSRPTVAPVAHVLQPEQRKHLAAVRALSVVVQEGPEVRALVYLPVPGSGDGASLRLAAPAPDLEAARAPAGLPGTSPARRARRRRRPRPPAPRRARSPPEGALNAYEQAMGGCATAARR
jgi:hypothetical protein